MKLDISPRPWAKRHALCHFAGIVCFIVSKLYRLYCDFRLAEIIAPENNKDSTKIKHS